MTYEGAYSIIGPFLTNLGASVAAVGFIAGLGEMIAASLRFFSGRFVDRTRAYWTMAIFGYFLNVVVVPAMAFAGNWKMAALLVVVERTGKSLRGPARDVLLSEATGKIGHGWGFGVHGAMDQTGAVLGPVMMYFAVLKSHNFNGAFLKLAFPAAGALLALLVARLVYPHKNYSAPGAHQGSAACLLAIRGCGRIAGAGLCRLSGIGGSLSETVPHRFAIHPPCCSPGPWGSMGSRT